MEPANPAPIPQTPDTTPLSQTQIPTAQPQTAATNAAITGRKVLCIEDEHFIAELYARALGKAGYNVKIVSDGVQGLAEAQTNVYDIILLDLMVPNLTGIEILSALKDPAKTTDLKSKIIITTNLEQREDVRAAIEKQADGYLVKAELTPRELATFIDSVQ